MNVPATSGNQGKAIIDIATGEKPDRYPTRKIFEDMSTPAAILTSALMLAVAGLFLFRWDLQAANDSAAQRPIDSYAVYRLDRWTGSVNRCATSVSISGTLKCD